MLNQPFALFPPFGCRNIKHVGNKCGWVQSSLCCPSNYFVLLSFSFLSLFSILNNSNPHAPTLQCPSPSRLDPDTWQCSHNRKIPNWCISQAQFIKWHQLSVHDHVLQLRMEEEEGKHNRFITITLLKLASVLDYVTQHSFYFFTKSTHSACISTTVHGIINRDYKEYLH